jgi:hypothetical protein
VLFCVLYIVAALCVALEVTPRSGGSQRDVERVQSVLVDQ